MPRILYLHGFGSCGESNKSRTLRSHFRENEVISPDLPYAPEEAVAFIDQLIGSGKIEMLIGSSLGGFYATYFAEKYALTAVVLNPSLQPWQTLAREVGRRERFCDGEAFEFKEAYLKQLETMRTEPVNGKYLVLLQSGDEVLDYRIAQEFYKHHHVVVEYGGNHRFENIDCYISMIERFGLHHECR